MNFRFTEEQSMLRDMARRWVAERYDLKRRKAAAATGFDRAAWAEIAEMGWQGVALPEAAGGSAGGAVETMIVMEEIGRGLMVEPYLATAVIAPAALTLTGAADDDARLAAIAGGRLGACRRPWRSSPTPRRTPAGLGYTHNHMSPTGTLYST